MTLKVYEEGLGPPSPNDLDVNIIDTSLVQYHGPTRTERMGDNFVRVEPQPEETDIRRPQAEDSHNILAGCRPSKTNR